MTFQGMFFICLQWWAGSVSSIWKTRFYGHLHTWSNPCDRSLITWTKWDWLATNSSIRSCPHSHSHSHKSHHSWLVGQTRSMSVQSVSVSVSLSRLTTLSSTVLCLKISSSSVHIRSYWHNNICDAFFLEDLINSLTTGLNRLRLNLLFDCKCSRSIAQAVYMSPDFYHDSTYANVFAGLSPRAPLPKRPLLPYLDIGLSIFSCSTLSAGFPICNPYDFMIICHFSNLFLPFYASLSCFLLFLTFTFVLLSPFNLDRISNRSNCF